MAIQWEYEVMNPYIGKSEIKLTLAVTQFIDIFFVFIEYDIRLNEMIICLK